MRGSIFDLNIYNHILQFVDGRGLARWMRTCKTICAHIRANPTMVALIEARVIVCETAADMIFAMIGEYTLTKYSRCLIPKIEMRKYLPLLSHLELKGNCYMHDNTYYILNVSESLDISQVRIARAFEKFNPVRFKFICTAVRLNYRCKNSEYRHTEFYTCLRFQEMDGEIIENWRKKRRIQ